MSYRPKALVLEAPGINCNEETAFAIDQAGGNSEQVHISQLQDGSRKISDYDILALSGGFSHGDAIRSGSVLGLQLKTMFSDELNGFVEDGKPIIGICNGFQTLIESGLLPTGKIDESAPKTTSLIDNENGKFECRWVALGIGKSACRFLNEELIYGPAILPVAHGEGRFITTDKLTAEEQTALFYCDEEGRPAQEYPANPNGSPEGVAGITNPSGTILGMMPHPERFVRPSQHPNWRREKIREPFGTLLFQNIVICAIER